MIEEENLFRLYQEDIYLVDEGKKPSEPASTSIQEQPSSVIEEPASTQITPTTSVEKKKETPVPKMPVVSKPTLENKLLVISEPLDDSSSKTLTKLIGALKLDQNDFKTIQSWTEDYNVYKRVLIFGYDQTANSLGELYNVIRKENHQVMRSPSIAMLNQQVAEKGKLWKALQQWFEL
ncbi:MAG: DNA polymerase III subunit psi [Cyclobacteriaceae bacterium]